MQMFRRGADAGKVELSASSRLVTVQALSVDSSDCCGPIVELLNKIQPKILWVFMGFWWA